MIWFLIGWFINTSNATDYTNESSQMTNVPIYLFCLAKVIYLRLLTRTKRDSDHSVWKLVTKEELTFNKRKTTYDNTLNIIKNRLSISGRPKNTIIIIILWNTRRLTWCALLDFVVLCCFIFFNLHHFYICYIIWINNYNLKSNKHSKMRFYFRFVDNY